MYVMAGIGIDACIDFFSGCLQKLARNVCMYGELKYCSRAVHSRHRQGEDERTRPPTTTRASKRSVLLLLLLNKHSEYAVDSHNTTRSVPLRLAALSSLALSLQCHARQGNACIHLSASRPVTQLSTITGVRLFKPHFGLQHTTVVGA